MTPGEFINGNYEFGIARHSTGQLQLIPPGTLSLDDASPDKFVIRIEHAWYEEYPLDGSGRIIEIFPISREISHALYKFGLDHQVTP